MACGCSKNRGRTRGTVFVWTSNNGMEVVPYATQLQAKARVLRDGGSYEPKDVVIENG